MIVIGLLAMISAGAAAPQVSGDFDGDGKPDIASIVEQPGGKRDIVVTFTNGRKEIVYSRVDEHVVLTIVSPAQIAEACKPIISVVAECARQASWHNREGLAFRPTTEQVSGTAFWTGSRFAAIFGSGAAQAASQVQTESISPLPSAASPRPWNGPCRLKDRRGNLIDMPTKFCSAVSEYFDSPMQSNDRSRHTTLELGIDRVGTVEACRILETSGSSELDAKACSIAVQKAHYSPVPQSGSSSEQTKRLRITWPR